MHTRIAPQLRKANATGHLYVYNPAAPCPLGFVAPVQGGWQAYRVSGVTVGARKRALPLRQAVRALQAATYAPAPLPSLKVPHGEGGPTRALCRYTARHHLRAAGVAL